MSPSVDTAAFRAICARTAGDCDGASPAWPSASGAPPATATHHYGRKHSGCPRKSQHALHGDGCLGMSPSGEPLGERQLAPLLQLAKAQSPGSGENGGCCWGIVTSGSSCVARKAQKSRGWCPPGSGRTAQRCPQPPLYYPSGQRDRRRRRQARWRWAHRCGVAVSVSGTSFGVLLPEPDCASIVLVAIDSVEVDIGA